MPAVIIGYQGAVDLYDVITVEALLVSGHWVLVFSSAWEHV